MMGKPTKAKKHISYDDEGLLVSRVEGEGLMVWFHLFIISFLEDDIRYYKENISNISAFSNKMGPRRWEIIDGGYLV